MAEQFGRTVHIEVVDVMGTGKCPSEYQSGRAWTVTDHMCPEGMCGYAFNSIQPFVMVLQYGGQFPWSDEPVAKVCCPDADNPVVFRLTVEQ